MNLTTNELAVFAKTADPLNGEFLEIPTSFRGVCRVLARQTDQKRVVTESKILQVLDSTQVGKVIRHCVVVGGEISHRHWRKIGHSDWQEVL